MTTPTLVQLYAGTVTLTPGRYWIGDPTALDYPIEEMHAHIDRYNFEGLYIEEGLVVGTFSRSLWDEAEYKVEGVDLDIDTTGMKGIRTSGMGVAILPVNDEQIVHLSTLTRTPWASGIIFETAFPFQVKRIGYNGADIHIETKDGSGFITLSLYNQNAELTVS